jgi:acetyl-CoA C-acetyltransferase
MKTPSQDPVVIVSVARTPMGGFQGDLKEFTSYELGAAAIRAAVERAGIAPDAVDEVLMGCVLPAGQGQAPARQAALGAGLPITTPATTVNKMCGSGMKATMLAHDLIAAGSEEIVVAGGMESMTLAPYLAPKARAGLRMGHAQLLDHMFLDGLEDAYERDEAGNRKLMGSFAEDTAQEQGFTREQQDAFAIRSTERAQAANANGWFAWETVPIALRAGKEQRFVEYDEQPAKARLDKIPMLKPAFRKGGTVTAANSSSISDGAAALVLMKQSKAEALGLKPLARIVAHSTHAQEPGKFATAPIGAIQKLFDKTGWTTQDVDLFEVNEAFAVVAMAAAKAHGIDEAKLNIHGGACALGHPIGASGARIIATLIGALRRTEGKRGVASLCIGGGEATAMALEML